MPLGIPPPQGLKISPRPVQLVHLGGGQKQYKKLMKWAFELQVSLKTQVKSFKFYEKSEDWVFFLGKP